MPGSEPFSQGLEGELQGAVAKEVAATHEDLHGGQGLGRHILYLTGWTGNSILRRAEAPMSLKLLSDLHQSGVVAMSLSEILVYVSLQAQALDENPGEITAVPSKDPVYAAAARVLQRCGLRRSKGLIIFTRSRPDAVINAKCWATSTSSS
jgi:hypothetical protein